MEARLMMPRTADEIMARADELARRFEDYEPEDDGTDARSLRDIASAFERRALAERDLTAAVTVARAEGHSWSAIGAMLGTSGEAARQRYGKPAAKPRKAATRSPAPATRSRSSVTRQLRTQGRVPRDLTQHGDRADSGQERKRA